MAATFAGTALVAYAVGSPSVHLVHGRPWAALGSVGLRGGLPFLGGVVWQRTATCPPPDGEWGSCGLGELIAGLTVGTLAAVALDALLLGWEQRPRQGLAARLTLAPVLSKDGQRELRLIGAF